jgi:hypothetical protein
MFIWICCIVFLRGHALNIGQAKPLPENDSNSKYGWCRKQDCFSYQYFSFTYKKRNRSEKAR